MDEGAAITLTYKSHLAWLSIERSNVGLDPVESRDYVHKRVVAWRWVVGSA